MGGTTGGLGPSYPPDQALGSDLGVGRGGGSEVSPLLLTTLLGCRPPSSEDPAPQQAPPRPPPREGCTALATGRHCQRVWVPFSLPASSRAASLYPGQAGASVHPGCPLLARQPAWTLRGVARASRAARPWTPPGTVWEVPLSCPRSPGELCSLEAGGHKTRRGTVWPHPATGGRPNSIGGGHGYLAAEPPLGSPRPGLHLGSIGPG